jgi:signal transduction histidine kinase
MNEIAIRADRTPSVASLPRVRRLTVVLFFSFLLLACLAGALHLAAQYSAAVDTAMRSARATARTAEAFTSRTLAETYRVLEGLGDLYAAQISQERFDESELHLTLKDKQSKLPHAAAVYILDAERRVVATGRAFPASMIKPDDLRRAAAAPTEVAEGLFIGHVYSSSEHAGKQHYLPVGVKIEWGGKMIGYAVAVIKPAFFEDFFATIDVGASGNIELWRTDGTLLAATGKIKTVVGEVNTEAMERLKDIEPLNEDARGLIYAVSDGYSRKVQSATVMPGGAMALTVMLEGSDYLESWRDSRNRVGLGIVVLLIAMALTSAFIFTQLKRSELNEMELRQAKASAEDANEAKSRFLAHMSHEFRTPLNAIMGFSEIIKNKVLGEGVSPVYVSYADHIHKSGEHLLNIVNDILDMAKIESGIQPLQADKISLVAVTETAVAFVDRLAGERGLRISVNVPVNLPQVVADERYLRQVLINLLTNAVKFSTPGLDVVIEARQHALGLDILVRDHGPGIDDAIMRRIGEPFLQGNPSITRIGQGAGLGLSICKQYMEMLGGELLISSEPNRGTTAAVRFPPHLLAEPPVRIAAE